MEKLDSSKYLSPRGGGLAGILIGFTYPLRALRLFQKHKSLRPYVIAPLGINILLGLVLYSLGIWQGSQWVNGLTARLIEWIGPAWLDSAVQLLIPVIHAVLIVFLFIALGFILLQFGGILGSPFYGQLSEKIETLRAGTLLVPPASGKADILIDIWRAILFELKKLLLLVAFGLPILLANFIPGIGPAIATIAGISLASLLVCLDMFDASLERRRLKFRQKLRMILQTLPASGGFALVSLGLISIPLMNLLAIPLCVSAGTLFFCDRILDQPRDRPS